MPKAAAGQADAYDDVDTAGAGKLEDPVILSDSQRERETFYGDVLRTPRPARERGKTRMASTDAAAALQCPGRCLSSGVSKQLPRAHAFITCLETSSSCRLHVFQTSIEQTERVDLGRLSYLHDGVVWNVLELISRKDSEEGVRNTTLFVQRVRHIDVLLCTTLVRREQQELQSGKLRSSSDTA